MYITLLIHLDKLEPSAPIGLIGTWRLQYGQLIPYNTDREDPVRQN